MYALGVWSACGLLILQRGFYALGDRRTPLRIGLLMVGLNLTLNFVLLWPLGGRGLALSTSISSMLQCLLTLRALHRSGHGINIGDFADGLLRTVIATAALLLGCFASDVALQAINLPTGFSGELLQLGAPIICGTLLYLIVAYMADLPEPFELLRRAK